MRVALCLAISVLLLACGEDDPYESLCDKMASCSERDFSFGSGGRDAQIDECIEMLESQERQAATVDCDDRWLDLIECMDDNFSCDNSQLGCNEDMNAYSECLSNSAPQPGPGSPNG